MRPRPWDWLFIIAPATVFILAFLVVALARISHPFELEWMEGGSWLQALRMAHGLPLYVKPTLEFTPFIYTPLYFWISAWLDGAGILTMPAMRCLSLASSIGVIVLLGRWVFRETGHRTAAALTMGIYAASYGSSGFFFDLARADALWMLLMLGSAYALYFHATISGHLISAALMVAAIYTKQQAVAVGAALCITALGRNRKLGLIFTGSWVLPSIFIFLLLNSFSHGWFRFYTLTLPSHHAWEANMLSGFWTTDLGLEYALPLLALILITLSRPVLSPLLYSLLCISLTSRLHTGGYLNVLMPVYAAVALASGLLWPKIVENPLFQENPFKPIRIGVVSLLISLQWVGWSYNPLFQIPSQADRESGSNLVEKLRNEVGQPFLPNHPYLAYLAGKKPLAHRMALEDVLRVKVKNADSLKVEFQEAIRSNSFSSIYLNSSNFLEEAVIPDNFPRHYRLSDSLFKIEEVFRPRAGMKLRPQFHFIPTGS